MKKVCLFRVPDIAAKLSCICMTAQKHFEQKMPLLLILPTNEAAAYIDELLWRQPEEGFLPHVIANGPTKELIAISTAEANVNNATSIFNLRPDITDFISEFDLIYDLIDLTHPLKAEQSRSRIDKYRSKSFFIEEISHVLKKL
jgi:DNA polymerase III subunit chi